MKNDCSSTIATIALEPFPITLIKYEPINLGRETAVTKKQYWVISFETFAMIDGGFAIRLKVYDNEQGGVSHVVCCKSEHNGKVLEVYQRLDQHRADYRGYTGTDSLNLKEYL